MKNKLLITTALVALVGVSNVMAAEHVNVDPAAEYNGSSYSNVEYDAEGGAFINYRNLTFLNDVSFDGNKATAGGAIYNHNNDSKNTVTIKENVSFKDNKASNIGGAVVNSANFNFVNTALFDANTALREGGAVYNTKGAKMTFAEKANFNNNTSGSFGGAIYNDGEITLKKDATFSGNSNKLYLGGALMNDVNGVVSFTEGASFSNNVSETGGAGALDNEGKVVFNGQTDFNSNIAKTKGGAIYNWKTGTIEFNGDTSFSGNKANGKLNDIHNLGSLTVSGDLELDGGISGTGTTIFESGSNLTVNTGTTTISNKVTNNGATLNLKLDNGFTGKYTLVTDGGSLDKEFNIASNNLYNITSSEDKKGTYDISKKSTAEVAAATGADANQASAITAVTSGTSSNATFNAVADNIGSLLQSSNKAEVQAGLNALTALAPEVSPMVQQTQTETANQVFGAVGTRLTGGSVSSSSQGMSSGDNIFERAAMWVQGLFNKSKLDDTSKAKGFDAKTNGIALGFEKFVTDDVKAGVGYAYSKTDIDGFMRDTDVKTHTAIAYGEYKPSNWYVNGIATYGWSDYSEKKNVAGVGVKADYDVETYGLQAMTGYDMNVNGINVTPETGLRYVHIKQDGYKDSADQRVSGNDSDILTGVIGAKVSKSWELENGMNIRPEARVAATYDLMNDDVNSVVTLANGSAYSVNGKALDRFGMEFGAGVTAEVNDKIEISLGYEGKFREDYKDHTGLLNAKYKF